MNKLFMAAGATAVVILAGCNSNMIKSSITEADLANHSFQLVQYDKTTIMPTKENKSLSLHFDKEMQVSGKMCNNLVGKAQLQGNVLTAQLAMTRMLCSDPLKNELDNVIGSMFAQGAQVKIDNHQLILESSSHQLRFKQVATSR